MRLFSGFATACLIVAAAVPVHAQTAAPSDSIVVGDSTMNIAATVPVAPSIAPSIAPGMAAESRAPSLTGLRAGVHRRESSRLVVNAAATNPHLGQSRALMIVGAAAFVTGAIIGNDVGTIIMVGGAVVGLYGLYQYLQ